MMQGCREKGKHVRRMEGKGGNEGRMQGWTEGETEAGPVLLLVSGYL